MNAASMPRDQSARAFTVFPAIDLRGGRVVRLAQGDYARETGYGDDPVELARRYVDAGARWLHVVDLDGARGESIAANARIIATIARIPGLSLQAGGGVRDEADVAARFDAGVRRVVVGSVSVREPGTVSRWLVRYGAESICVALDARADETGTFRLPVHGWTEASGRSLDELLASYRAESPLRHVLCTDIARDGMLGGANVDLYRRLAQAYPTLAFQASGGVRDLADVVAARDAGAAGVIVGKALLDGRIGIEALLAC